jgi:cytochrome c-type biogenesis protein CcmH/NrfG
MTDDFPERSGVFREQIGDIRMMQKDYRSAIWNYRQAMEIDPLKIEIKNKIVKVETLQNRQRS